MTGPVDFARDLNEQTAAESIPMRAILEQSNLRAEILRTGRVNTRGCQSRLARPHSQPSGYPGQSGPVAGMNR